MNTRFASYLFFLAVILLNAGCSVSKRVSNIRPGDGKLQTDGRINIQNPDVAEIYWPGSSVKIKFSGTEVKATLKDERGFNFFNVIIDDSLLQTLKIDTAKTTYTLVAGLPEGNHTVELSKRADWFRGKTLFYGFQLASGSKLLQLPAKKRMIEFYGNSITVGAAVEDNIGDKGDSTFTNNYRSYASITARHFNARYSCIASSGIGIMVSWGSLIMPEIYDRLNPDDSTSKWDFSKAQPDIVVINLFQNDCALLTLPEHAQFKRRFGDKNPTEEFIIKAYSNFVQRIRDHYPGAYIVCVLGTMDAVKPGSPWPGYIEKSVTALHDPKILTHFFAYKNSPGHPKVQEQKKMADDLIRFIDSHIQW